MGSAPFCIIYREDLTYPIIFVTPHQGKDDRDLPTVSLLLALLYALVQAGRVLLLIPSNLTDKTYRTLCGRPEGILLIGGGDVVPARSRSETYPVNSVDGEFDSIVLSLLDILCWIKSILWEFSRSFM
jgi:hypothetical protein